MDTVVLSSLLNGALLLVCLGLLFSFCVSCGQSGRQTPIHQQGGFTIIRGKATVNTNGNNHIHNRTPAPSPLRSPWQEPERRPSYTSTEDDDGSYVNKDSDSYIYVISDEMPSTPKDESQPNLGSGNGDYMNVEPDNREYINMLEFETEGLTPGKSQESKECDGNGSTDYVNICPK